jgi:hypothetical protein
MTRNAALQSSVKDLKLQAMGIFKSIVVDDCPGAQLAYVLHLD